MKKCATIASAGMCLPEATRRIFCSFNFSLAEANILWEKLRHIVNDFNGNAEKFYCQFYGLLEENSEVANHVLIHLSGIIIDANEPAKIASSVSDKEVKCLQYVT